ncbi:O-acetylhomoserine sulfhydrylase /O-succinylhomoserine sulfhydrylase [Vibrio astriarenae]|nr:O-acetylhomoserine sulfhydrylase /O-succinylhomoserine sulfhydrylase [Vibrio sp. C7]
MKDETLSIHFGYETDPTTKSVATPIYQTVAYEFDNAQHGADLFNLEVPGNIYTRIMNPTNDVLEKRMAALEGGIAGLVVSAGSAAINYAILTLAQAGDNIVSTPQLYGGTYTLFAHMLPNQGIEVRFAKDDKPESLAELIDDNTKAVYCESIGNPAGNIIDLERVAELAHAQGVPVIVDNTVATPALCKPIEFGADIVVHSLTKYVGGHGTTLGGIIIDSGKFPWAEHKERFPVFNTPEPLITEWFTLKHSVKLLLLVEHVRSTAQYRGCPITNELVYVTSRSRDTLFKNGKTYRKRVKGC